MKHLYLGLVITMTACSSTPPTPPTPQEKLVQSSPGWYLVPPTEDGAIYAAGMSSSPDLQFSIDKALLQAKSGLADRVKGETSVLSRSHASQSGNVVSRSDDKTVKNFAKDVNLGGYELVKSEIIPDTGTFRAYVLLKYVPAGGGLDKAVALLDETHTTGTAPVGTAPVAVTTTPSFAPKKVIAFPIGMAPANPVNVNPLNNDEPPPPSAAPREPVTQE